MNEYEQQACEFLESTGSKLSWKLNGVTARLGGKRTLEWEFTLSRGERKYVSEFNSSINDLHELLKFEEHRVNPDCLLAERILNDFAKNLEDGKKKFEIRRDGYAESFVSANFAEPSNYDLLACLQGYEVAEKFWDFVTEFGYEIDNDETYNRAKQAHKGCLREFRALQSLYNDAELEKLNKIC